MVSSPRRPRPSGPATRRGRRLRRGRSLSGLANNRLESGPTVGARCRLEQRLGSGLTAEALPVAGPLEDGEHGLGRLRTDSEPVQRALGVDLDQRRVLLGVVLADLLDGSPITLGTCVGNNDAVVGRADLAQALQLDLDGHGFDNSSWMTAGARRLACGVRRRLDRGGRGPRGKRAERSVFDPPLCQTRRHRRAGLPMVAHGPEPCRTGKHK